MLIYRYPARCREKGCKSIGTHEMSTKGVYVYRYPERHQGKECKFIGTMRDVEKWGCKSIGTMQDVEKRGVNL